MNQLEQLAHDAIRLRRKSKIYARLDALKTELLPWQHDDLCNMVKIQLGLLPNYVYLPWAPRIKPEDIIDDTASVTDTV